MDFCEVLSEYAVFHMRCSVYFCEKLSQYALLHEMLPWIFCEVLSQYAVFHEILWIFVLSQYAGFHMLLPRLFVRCFHNVQYFTCCFHGFL